MQDNYADELNRLKKDGVIERWQLRQPGFTDAVVTLPPLDREGAHQLATALLNRGDHRNDDDRWRALTTTLTTISRTLDRVHDVVGSPPARYEVVATFVDGYVERTEFVASGDATFHAHATTTGQRTTLLREHGACARIEISPLN